MSEIENYYYYIIIIIVIIIIIIICSDYCERHDLTFNAKKIYVHVFQYLYK